MLQLVMHIHVIKVREIHLKSELFLYKAQKNVVKSQIVGQVVEKKC